jgi:hypothetical protein
MDTNIYCGCVEHDLTVTTNWILSCPSQYSCQQCPAQGGRAEVRLREREEISYTGSTSSSDRNHAASYPTNIIHFHEVLCLRMPLYCSYKHILPHMRTDGVKCIKLSISLQLNRLTKYQ